MIRDVERAIDIYKRRSEGQTYLTIGIEHGISLNRTRQIHLLLERMRKHPSREGMSQEQFLSDLQSRSTRSEEHERIEIRKRNVERLESALAKAATRRDAMRRALALAEQAHSKAEMALRKAQDELAQERK